MSVWSLRKPRYLFWAKCNIVLIRSDFKNGTTVFGTSATVKWGMYCFPMILFGCVTVSIDAFCWTCFHRTSEVQSEKTLQPSCDAPKILALGNPTAC